MARVMFWPGPKTLGFFVLMPLTRPLPYMKSTELAAHLNEPETSVNLLDAVCCTTLKVSVPLSLPLMV